MCNRLKKLSMSPFINSKCMLCYNMTHPTTFWCAFISAASSNPTSDADLTPTRLYGYNTNPGNVLDNKALENYRKRKEQQKLRRRKLDTELQKTSGTSDPPGKPLRAFIVYCSCVAVSCSVCISVSAPTTTLCYCKAVNLRCSVLCWAAVDN